MNGIQEVSGSIPLISTKENLETTVVSRFFLLRGESARFSNTFLTALHRQFGAHKKCPPQKGGHFLSIYSLSDESSGGFSGREGVSASFSVMVGIKALASFPCPRRLI